MCERCNWSTSNPLMIKYHDEEWGVPLYDDLKLFEFLTLEGFQAGLSWQIVLNKREAFRLAFDDFDYFKVAEYNENKINELMNNSGIIRNRAKIIGCINNAQKFIELIKEFGSFSNYMWAYVENKPVINQFQLLSDLPAKTDLSDIISADLKNRGFKFIGSTVIYAHLQATGVVNDHLISCFRYNEIISSYE